MEKKICKKCLIEKDICEFSKKSSSKDGLQKICKNCDKLKSKEYREKNKEKYKLSQKKTYRKYKNKYLMGSKEYYLSNKETIIKRNKKYYLNNLDSIKLRKKLYWEKNRETQLFKKKEYSKINRKNLTQKEKDRRDSDPLFRTIRNIRNRINQYLKSKNYIKNNKSFTIVGCSPEFLKEHIEKQFTEGMSWEKMGQYIHIDHIIPLSSAKTEEEVLKLCHYTNLQPLWAEDNLKKKDKIK
jgi:hypothetical protein